MSYDKFNYSNATANEIKEIERKSRLPDSDKSLSYADRSIGTIYITGGGFIRRPFTGIGSNSRFGWQELVWYKPPTRAMNFAFSNMDDIDVGLVARCEINIKYMNYQDYVDLRKILGRERHFMVEFFDTDDKEWVSRDMYCSENTISKFMTLKQSLIGSLDYVIKLVGTNLDLEEIIGVETTEGGSQLKKFTVKYNPNGGGGSAYSDKISWGGYVDLPSGTVFTVPSGKSSFSHWERRLSGVAVGAYGANQRTTVWEDMDLYAVWK